MALLSQAQWPDGPSAWAVILRCRAGKQNLAGCFLGSKESMGPASRCSPPCAKGGQHGNAMQGGIDSTQLPGRYQVPGVGMVSQVPSIPQSAFADSSLCTREPSLLPSIQLALSVPLSQDYTPAPTG